MAARFWVGGTGTWDASDTTHWAATSNGAGGQSVPGSGDTVTFDGNSGGGTVTVNTTINVQSITAGAFTGTLAFDTNNNNVTSISVSFGGTGTRTINMGSGTWTVTGGAGVTWDCATTTNLTATFQNASINFTGTHNTFRDLRMGGLTYGAITIANNSSKGYTLINGTSGITLGSLTVGNGNTMGFNQGMTTTITGALTITGTSSVPGGLITSGPGQANATVSVGSASALDWCGVFRITKAGAGSITATNSLDMGANSGVTITAPGGGGVIGVIGG